MAKSHKYKWQENISDRRHLLLNCLAIAYHPIFLLYKTKQGETRIEVIFNSETFWMSQKRMADLFGVDVRTINYHLGQIYESGELTKEATIRKLG